MSLATLAPSAPRIVLRAHSPASRRRGREAAFNWLAFGLLLSAWNGVDDSASRLARPEPLRDHRAASVRENAESPRSQGSQLRQGTALVSGLTCGSPRESSRYSSSTGMSPVSNRCAGGLARPVSPFAW